MSEFRILSPVSFTIDSLLLSPEIVEKVCQKVNADLLKLELGFSGEFGDMIAQSLIESLITSKLENMGILSEGSLLGIDISGNFLPIQEFVDTHIPA